MYKRLSCFFFLFLLVFGSGLGGLTACFVAVQNTPSRNHGRKQNKLHKTTRNTVQHKNSPYFSGIQSKPSIEEKRQLCVFRRVLSNFKVEKDSHVLIVRDGVKGQEEIGHHDENGLMGEDFNVSR